MLAEGTIFFSGKHPYLIIVPMGFTTLATSALTAMQALPEAMQAYSAYQQGKTFNNIARKQEALAQQQAAAMNDTAVDNQQRAARNAAMQLSHARGDAAQSQLLHEGSIAAREKDLATRLQDEISAQANAALDQATRTRQQGTLQAWHTRNSAAQARTKATTAALGSVSSLFSGIAQQLSLPE